MKTSALLISVAALLLGDSVNAYVPQGPKPRVNKNVFDVKKAAASAFTALTIASNLGAGVPTAEAVDVNAMYSPFSSSTVVAEKVTREGLYKSYEVDITQEVDDARSTFKAKTETKTKKGKYTALLAVLVVGSFVIPMAQYFWYVRDDDSSDKFFAQDIPDPPKPKKKGWF